MKMNRFYLSRFFIYLMGIACALSVTSNAIAQNEDETTEPIEFLSFDRPEAWALKYFTSASLLSGLQTSDRTKTGSVAVGIEVGWLPELSSEQLRVGFNGTKEEDLNKAPVFMRPRVTIGLPGRFSVIIAGTPPIRAFGITSRLFAVGLERPILERDGWSLGWRAYGQVGSVKGAFTCPAKALAFPAGSAENPTGCVSESSDVASLWYAGGEMQVARRIPKLWGLTPHAAVGVNFVHGRFQVNAPLVDELDRDRLQTQGATLSATAGVAYPVTQRIEVALDLYYSPLWVKRDFALQSTNDGLFNVRTLFSYRF